MKLRPPAAGRSDGCRRRTCALAAALDFASSARFAAEFDDNVVRCLPPSRANPRQIWLLTHAWLRHTPRVRIVLDFLAEQLRRHALLVAERLAVRIAA